MPPRETSSSAATRRRELDELRTIQLLEETVGPKGLRQLRRAMKDEAGRRVLETVARQGVDDLRDLDEVLHEWARVVGEDGPPEAPVGHEALPTEEVLRSVVELKESEAQMFRRSAETAPTDRIRTRLLNLAARQEAAAEKLKSLL